MVISPIRANRTNGFLASNGDHRKTFNERRTICIVRYSPIGIHVRYGNVLTMQHAPTRDAVVQWKPLPLPQRCDGIFLGVIAQIAVAQDDRHAVSMDKLPRCITKYSDDSVQIATTG